MARLGSWYGVAAWAALAAALGCSSTGTPCKKRGVTEACSCSGGAKGSRQCLPEHVWDRCDCSASPAMDAGKLAAPGGGDMGGKGGGGASGSGASGSGGANPIPPNPVGDKDAGDAPDAMIATGHDGGGGSGGQGDGGGGMGGSGGAVAPTGNVYGKCTDESDCKITGSRCNVVAGIPPLSEDSSGCEPPCQDASDCPVPAGSYDATLTCVDQQCELDCTPDLLGPDRSCPAGLTCTASLLATSTCLAP